MKKIIQRRQYTFYKGCYKYKFVLIQYWDGSARLKLGDKYIVKNIVINDARSWLNELQKLADQDDYIAEEWNKIVDRLC